MFAQNLKEFFQSKTNWTGLSMILGSAIGGYLSTIDPVTAVQGIMSGLALIVIKDAIVKT